MENKSPQQPKEPPKRPRKAAGKISAEEISQARADSDNAKTILEDKGFEFFRSFLRERKEAIIENAVNNRIHKTVVKKQDGSEVIYERWEQEAEQSGEFKFLFKLVNWLTEVQYKPAMIEKAIEEGRLIVEG